MKKATQKWVKATHHRPRLHLQCQRQIPLDGDFNVRSPMNLRSLSLTPFLVSHTQILRLLGHAGLRRMFTNHSDADAADEEDDDEPHNLRSRLRPRAKQTKYEFSPVPSEEGTKLMRSGTFGCTDYYRNILKRRNKRLATRLMTRELGTERSHPTGDDKIIAQVCDSSLRFGDECN